MDEEVNNLYDGFSSGLLSLVEEKSQNSKLSVFDAEPRAGEELATTLLVDDQQFNLVALQQMFEFLDVSTDISLSGRKAIEMLTQRVESN